MSLPGSQNPLRILDWVIVGGYFVLTVWLGSYFSKRQISSERYFLGNRKLPGWAIGMSIFATIISSWAFLALPGKAFKDDLQYLLTILPIPLTVLIATFFLIPVFRKRIRLSAYEYLERRFGLIARFYGNIVFISGHFFKMGMVLFLLCLAIEGATGWPDDYLTYLVVVVGIITIVYTFLGGVEGVVWAHVIQGFLLLVGGLVGLLFVLFSGEAGPAEMVAAACDAGKFKLANFDFDWNRLSIWVLVCFGFTHYLARYTTDQTVIQRYLLAPSSKQASRSLWVSVMLLGIVWVVFMSIGALLWVYYDIQPDLLPESVRQKPDQVFAYFIGHQIPVGVTGLILAGVFAAAMSTLSSDLNSLASVLVEDFYGKLAKVPSDRRRLVFSRLSIIAAGIGAIFLALALRRVKSMVEAFFVFNAIMAGGMIGMFFLGLLTRRCSKKGLYIGLVIGVIFIAWATFTNPAQMDPLKLPWLPKFGIHIYWLGLLGNIVVFVAGYLASLIFTPGHSAEVGLTVYGKAASEAADA
ncbi:MAG: sodium:solute symporter family transporter [Planctomycetota bacterium]